MAKAAVAAKSAAAASRGAGTKVAATAKPAAAKATKTAATTIKAATIKAATIKAATIKAATINAASAKATTVTPAAPARRPRPTPRPRSAAVEPAPDVAALVATEPLGDIEDAGTLVAAEEARSLAVEKLTDVPAETTDVPDEATAVVVELGRAAGAHRGRWSRLSSSVLRRRRALCLAAALVSAVGVGAVSAGSAAQADPAERSSHSMSVAAELGISSQQTGVAPDAGDTDRLAELAASRATREAEQTAAVQAQQDADRAAAAAIAEAARPKAVLPVNGARFTSGFGFRWGTLHAGIDLAAPIGTPEYAAMDGVVLEAGPASGFGLAVYIQHANGDVTVYGHMEQILVQPGQVVKAGDTIALLGNQGQSTGPHLHFEVHIGGLNGEKVDPIPWLHDRGVDV